MRKGLVVILVLAGLASFGQNFKTVRAKELKALPQAAFGNDTLNILNIPGSVLTVNDSTLDLHIKAKSLEAGTGLTESNGKISVGGSFGSNISLVDGSLNSGSPSSFGLTVGDGSIRLQAVRTGNVTLAQYGSGNLTLEHGGSGGAMNIRSLAPDGFTIENNASSTFRIRHNSNGPFLIHKNGNMGEMEIANNAGDGGLTIQSNVGGIDITSLVDGISLKANSGGININTLSGGIDISSLTDSVYISSAGGNLALLGSKISDVDGGRIDFFTRPRSTGIPLDPQLRGYIDPSGSWSFQGNQLKGLGEPTEDSDAVTKGYVDSRTTQDVTIADDNISFIPSANISAISDNESISYYRIGDAVLIWGFVNVQPSSVGTSSIVKLVPPIVSDFTNARDVGGSVTYTGGSYAGNMNADISGNTINLSFIPEASGNQSLIFFGTYIVK